MRVGMGEGMVTPLEGQFAVGSHKDQGGSSLCCRTSASLCPLTCGCLVPVLFGGHVPESSDKKKSEFTFSPDAFVNWSSVFHFSPCATKTPFWNKCTAGVQPRLHLTTAFLGQFVVLHTSQMMQPSASAAWAESCRAQPALLLVSA